MGEHHSTTTSDASPAVSQTKTTSDEDLSSYIGGSLSPSFKAKVMISTNAADEHIEDCDMGMEGVEEEEVTSLAVQTTLSQAAAAFRDQVLVADTTVTASSTTTDILTTPLTEEGEKMKDVDQSIEPITPVPGQEESADQDNDDEDSSDDDDEDSDGGSHGLDEEPSMVSTTDAVYSAVPISSELHIFPHSSKGFNWNQDLFLKPHQRRNLGVDELHSAFNNSVGGVASSRSSSSSNSSSRSNSSGSNHQGGMSAVRVHEIRLDQLETDQILPSH
ncbi:hypothetical protein BGX24_007905 [Mortierella sp. AD032]|nr:hypothetical protein BGX24_007905 [Mortierella sp. AD032]